LNVASVSVLICTFNRAGLLLETLRALAATTPPTDARVEIIVVDNNSTDDTGLVTSEVARHSPVPIIGLRETAQGKSFALNRGLQAATGDVIALTDDDVCPDPAWLSRIVDTFRERDVTFVFGKVLPRWGAIPAPELLTPKAQDLWGPLAIVDYGDEPIEYLVSSAGQRLPIGANLAFSRQALLTIGGWRTDLGKVNNSLISGEDHEIFMRLRRFHLYKGHYDPDITVRHLVPAARLTRAYFRRWFFWHGKTHALMLDDLYPDVDMKRVPRILGVPRFLYRQSAEQAWRWLRSLGHADALHVLTEELRTIEHLGVLHECWSAVAGRMLPRRVRHAETRGEDRPGGAGPGDPDDRVSRRSAVDLGPTSLTLWTSSCDQPVAPDRAATSN
jgi:glycosyltransferase involved in cell wall biosynthesis